jgi:site-specific DNA-cytosine methylase
MEKEFDFEKAVQKLLSGKKLTGKDGVLTPLIKELVETALEAEITSHLNLNHREDKPNRRNGYNKKTIKGDKSTSLRTNSSNGNMWVNEKAIRETKPKQVDNREPKVAVEYKAMTEVRTPEANKIRREHKKKTGKDWSPREMRHLIERDDDKMNALTSALTKQHIVQEKKQLIEEERIVVDKEKKQLLIAEATKKGYTVIEDGDCFDINFPNSKTRRGRNMKYKCNALTTASQNFMRFENLSWRKLTPLECERLQTVPDNYTNHVSNTQRYKMLGNGWTVDVIAHILNNMEL